MLILIALLTLALVAKLSLQGGRLMGLPEEVIALRGEVAGLKARVIADIQKLHDLLTLPDPNVDAALAAIAEIRADFGEITAAVDVPEPGDEPPAA